MTNTISSIGDRTMFQVRYIAKLARRKFYYLETHALLVEILRSKSPRLKTSGPKLYGWWERLLGLTIPSLALGSSPGRRGFESAPTIHWHWVPNVAPAHNHITPSYTAQWCSLSTWLDMHSGWTTVTPLHQVAQR